jgi:hypothetical protein
MLKSTQNNLTLQGYTMNESPTSNLIPVTSLAESLNLNIKKSEFTGKYIPITMIQANKLFVDELFQRLVITKMIKNAGKFRPELARPLFVFLRPDGKYSVADGQHEAILAVLYTAKSGDQELPCQVIVHDKNFTDEQCVNTEAKYFKELNLFRTNVGTIDQLRANIALRDEESLEILGKLNDMGIHIEKLGYTDGPEVYGYTKLMQAYDKYGISCVRKGIQLYQKLQRDDNFPKWNKTKDPLNGGLIGGLSAVFHLIDGGYIGIGDRYIAIKIYLDNFLGEWNTIKGKDALVLNTAGSSQSILIARRIVFSCNQLTKFRTITKQNGDKFKNEIDEVALSNAGLGDPSK